MLQSDSDWGEIKLIFIGSPITRIWSVATEELTPSRSSCHRVCQDMNANRQVKDLTKAVAKGMMMMLRDPERDRMKPYVLFMDRQTKCAHVCRTPKESASGS